MLSIWEAVLADCYSSCASTTKEQCRDICTARANAHSRGLGFFCLDLPHLDSLLLSLLEEGSVVFSGPLTGRRKRGDRRPKFLWSFWSRICDASGCLLAEPDVDAIAFLRQLSSLWKKLSVECSSDRTRSTVDDYIHIEASIPSPELAWEDDNLRIPRRFSFVSHFMRNRHECLFPDECEPQDEALLRRLDSVAGILISGLGQFDSMSADSPESGFFKHGPGRVSNLPKDRYKYTFPEWSYKLEGVFPYDWCSGAPLGSYPKKRTESPGRLIAVPKTYKSPRLIASEPVEHQWCQQKIATWLERAIRSSTIGEFIDLRDQSKSQVLVDQASLDRSLATIDLSSASDRVSCRAIECLLASNLTLLEAAHAVRTRWIEDKVCSSGFIKLRKFSTQGSALTFPMQSIFFTCIALASAGATTKGDILRLRGKVRVFGDDIIVPNHAYDSTVRLLTILGLKVSTSKSFSKGYFRESCGRDSYKGYDVTPVKPKHCTADTLESTFSLIDASNNLFKKGFWKGAKAVERLIPHTYRRQVFSVKDYSGGVGLQAFSGSLYSNVKWDRALHYWYVNQPIIRLNVEVITRQDSLALREHFTRPWNAENPRILGPRRKGVAKLATSRVPVLR